MALLLPGAHVSLGTVTATGAPTTTAVAKPSHCPQYHTLSYNDPSGPVLMPDGTWHIFPINGNWGHCTSLDLLVWNCSHPSTGWNISNTGGLTVTSAGFFLTQANNYNVSAAKAADDLLDIWEHANGSTCGSIPGDSQCVAAAGHVCPSAPCHPQNTSTPFVPCRTTVCGVIGNPTVPFPGTESLSDTGRALRLKSGWYLPVGARGPKNAGGGIHWFKVSDEAMTHIEETGFLFTVNIAPNGSSVGPLLECPDVFLLDGKVVVLGSLPGMPVNTEGTSHWWVGKISDDDMTFSPESTGQFDWGLGGFSSIYAAKSGTQAVEPFTRRVLFGFGGWREGMALESECGGGFYVLPRELSISPLTGKLQQRPVVELQRLRQGDAMHSPENIAVGAQVEVLVQCRLPAGASLPSKGIVAVSTLQTANQNQTVQVGFDFNTKRGFAMVPPSLGLFGNTSRVDVTPQLDVFNDSMMTMLGGTEGAVEATATTDTSIELHVFVDGGRVETFYGSETTITTSVRNTVPGSQLTSSFVNTVEASQLHCNVTSWSLALPAMTLTTGD